MKGKNSGFKAKDDLSDLKKSSDLRYIVGRVLDRKFNSQRNSKAKDDCDSCGEKCFD